VRNCSPSSLETYHVQIHQRGALEDFKKKKKRAFVLVLHTLDPQTSCDNWGKKKKKKTAGVVSFTVSSRQWWAVCG
jgi:hypothetical protein